VKGDPDVSVMGSGCSSVAVGTIVRMTVGIRGAKGVKKTTTYISV
jgi:hypothetical protein